MGARYIISGATFDLSYSLIPLIGNLDHIAYMILISAHVSHLINLDLALAQLHLGLFNLLLELGVRLRNVVEGKDRETQTGEKITGKDDQSVEWKLDCERIVLALDWYIQRGEGGGSGRVGRGRHTTGMISDWTVSFRGTRPRNRDRYS